MQCIFYSFFDFGVYLFVEIHISMALDIIGKVFLGHLISLFVFSIFFISVLYGIVGQMDVSIFQIL